MHAERSVHILPSIPAGLRISRGAYIARIDQQLYLHHNHCCRDDQSRAPGPDLCCSHSIREDRPGLLSDFR